MRDALRERTALVTRENTVAVGGVFGPYWLTTAWVVRDEARSASAFSAAERAASLGAERWITLQRGSLFVHDSVSDVGRAVRALPQACDVRLLSTRAGAWVCFVVRRKGASEARRKGL